MVGVYFPPSYRHAVRAGRKVLNEGWQMRPSTRVPYLTHGVDGRALLPALLSIAAVLHYGSSSSNNNNNR